VQVGRHHKFSAALVIGGKSVEEEREHIAGMNIVVATPGRLLHHLEQTPNFTCDRLQLLVLDEADLILVSRRYRAGAGLRRR
jgi:ATP-dependent RNA helicase DDX10/DBP4